MAEEYIYAHRMLCTLLLQANDMLSLQRLLEPFKTAISFDVQPIAQQVESWLTAGQISVVQGGQSPIANGMYTRQQLLEQSIWPAIRSHWQVQDNWQAHVTRLFENVWKLN